MTIAFGKGGFGKVYKGELVHSKGQTMVALKRLDRAFGQGDPEFWKEIIMLTLYKHENIVSLLGFCDESGEKILVYDYVSKRSLDLYLNNDELTWVRRLKICIGAARGLAYLHNPAVTQQRVLHRDIKSANILLDENWNPRISDMGLSKFGPANQQYTFLVSNAVGTFGYWDPIYAETGLLTKESDVYSFDVVLFEVLCGRLCMGNTNDKLRPLTGLVRECYQRNKIDDIICDNIKAEINPNSLEAFTTIAYQCLNINREERPSMEEIVKRLESALEHQIINEFNCDTLQQRLQGLIDMAQESWTYGIFWQSSVVDYTDGSPVLDWGDGYYKGEANKPITTPSATSLVEQQYRKEVLWELNSLISGTQVPENDAVDEEITDIEWFFLISMAQSFGNGNGLPGQAAFTNEPVWVAGREWLLRSHCERARQGHGFGLQTIVCIPSTNGVIELGSTELIFPSSDVMNKVRALFNFNNSRDIMQINTDQGGTTQVRYQPRHGRFLAAATGNMVFVLDVETQACRHSLTGHTKPIISVCWDPNGEYLASVCENSVRVWSLMSGNEGECVHNLNCNGNKFHSCVFHPSYASLLVIGCDQSLQLWNMSENKTLTLSAHKGEIGGLAVSTVTGLVVSGSEDGIVKLC